MKPLDPNSFISFQNISVCFQSKQNEINAVRNASFDIRKSEVFGIVGTSGAGKSTLLRSINLLQRPTQGEIFIAGQETTQLAGSELRKLRSGIGMIFQSFNLINSKSVFENVAFAMKAVGKSKEEIKQRVPEVLNLVGLTNRADFYPSKLSGGEKQRVGIARALANNPQILLCDEPTSALDLDNTNAILELLKDINRKLGITTVIISHEMDVIKKICDRVAVMSHGNIIELGNVFDVFATPQHEFTKVMVKHTFDLELPDRIQPNIKNRILKIIYSGQKAEESVISDTIRRYDVHINILHGKIEYISGKPFGILIVSIDGNKEKIQDVEAYLKTRTYSVEEII